MKTKRGKRGLPPPIEQLPEQQTPSPPGGWPDEKNPYIALRGLRGSRAPTKLRVGIKKVANKWCVYIKRSGRECYFAAFLSDRDAAAEKAKNLIGQVALIVWDESCDAL